MTVPGESDDVMARPSIEPRSVRAVPWSRLRDPVVLILVLAGIFDWLSGNPIHSILLFAAAASLLWEAVRPDAEAADHRTWMVQPGDARSSGTLGPVLLIAALAFSVLVGGFGRYSWPATVAVAVPGAFALVFAWRSALPDTHELESGGRAEPFALRGIVVWISVVVALGLFELTNLLLQPSLTTDSYAHPTLSVMTDPVLASHPGRSAVLFLWLALGWFLFRR